MALVPNISNEGLNPQQVIERNGIYDVILPSLLALMCCYFAFVDTESESDKKEAQNATFDSQLTLILIN